MTREDFDKRKTGFEHSKGAKWEFYILFGCPLIAISWLLWRAHGGDSLIHFVALVFIGALAGFATALIPVWALYASRIRSFGLVCPSCSAHLVKEGKERLAAGCCPDCGIAIIDGAAAQKDAPIHLEVGTIRAGFQDRIGRHMADTFFQIILFVAVILILALLLS